MFRKMRRIKQQLPMDACMFILDHATCGVLALSGDNDYPYTVPLNFVLNKDKLYFHCATEGHKLDAIRRNPKASFCIIDENTVAARFFSTLYRSVIVFGTVRIVEEEDLRRQALAWLADKFAPHDSQGFEREMEKYFTTTCVLEMTIQHISGKEAKRLAEERVRS